MWGEWTSRAWNPVWLQERRPGTKGIWLERQEVEVREWNVWHGEGGGAMIIDNDKV